MWTGPTNAPGVTGEPGVTGAPGEPGVVGVVGVPGLPSVVGGTGYRVPVPGTSHYRDNRVPVLPVHVQTALVGRPVTAEPTLSSLTGTVTGVARRGSFHRAFDLDRGGLYQIAYPKAESPGGGFGPKGKASKSVAEA